MPHLFTPNQKWKRAPPPPTPPSPGSVLPAEDVTCSTDCASASLAATSEPAGAGWDHTESTAGNRLSRLLLSVGFSVFFFFCLIFFRPCVADQPLLDTRVFLAVATYGSSVSLSRQGGKKKKKKVFRLISLGHG